MKKLIVLALLAALPVAAQDPPIPEDKDPKTAESGLKISILKQGKPGTEPTESDAVEVHYVGWLESGKVFDSSRKRGEPIRFPLTGVIKGWTEGLQHMTVGSTAKLTIPADLAYGERGRPGIPPDATLIFEIELLDVIRWYPAEEDAQKTTESGIKWQVIRAGSGKAPSESDGVVLEWAFWNTEGKLIDLARNEGRRIAGPCSGLPLDFMKEVVPMMKGGGKYRFEVPPELCFRERPGGPGLPPNSTTVWTLELLEINDVPDFVMPPEDELQKTESGLAYQVVEPGEEGGGQPKLGEEVTVHYAGWLTDGKLFDSSWARGEPATFQLRKGGLIDGWTEGVPLMREGAVYRFVIPPDLAYGARGRPPQIPADATLVFLIELKKAGK